MLHHEEDRCGAYLNSATRPRLMRVLLEECVVLHADQLFEGVKDMFYALYDNSQVIFFVAVMFACADCVVCEDNA